MYIASDIVTPFRLRDIDPIVALTTFGERSRRYHVPNLPLFTAFVIVFARPAVHFKPNDTCHDRVFHGRGGRCVG
jgi:hypothetical protein